jgi:hypothetical protein
MLDEWFAISKSRDAVVERCQLLGARDALNRSLLLTGQLGICLRCSFAVASSRPQMRRTMVSDPLRVLGGDPRIR